MAGDDKKASAKAEAVLHEQKAGTLKSGATGKTVTSREQAIAIGLSEARREGDRVPAQSAASAQNSAAKKSAAKTTAARTASAKKVSPRAPPAKRAAVSKPAAGRP